MAHAQDTDIRPPTSRTAGSVSSQLHRVPRTRRRRRAVDQSGSGKFRRGTTDDEIVKIILGGIPGTAMPPSSFSEGQRDDRRVSAIARRLADDGGMLRATPRADRRSSRARGSVRTVTASLAWEAHRTVAQRDRGAAARDRAAAIDRRTQRRHPIGSSSGPVAMRDGSTITGRLLNQDTFTIQRSTPARVCGCSTSPRFREVTIPKESPMPSYRTSSTRRKCRSRHLSDDAEGPR